MTFVPWSGLLAGVVAMGNPVAVAMGFLLMGLLTAEGDRGRNRRRPALGTEMTRAREDFLRAGRVPPRS